MSAVLPPVPDLIPISALRKGSGNNNNNNSRVRECAPCSSTQCSGEVMGEQRSRRTGQPAAFEAIDTTSRSRGSGDGAAPQQPAASRKARTERHRKSDRRRDRVRERRKRSTSSKPRSVPASPERPANPRVNPIFVWVRQQDNHIVEVKCEDYDKRNRILLTKTAQGWRAIPRTETLAPALQKTDDKPHRKPKKHKVKRKSAAVQADENHHEREDPAWTEVSSEPTEPIPEKSPPSSVNSASDCSAQDANAATTATDECHNKCDVTPLDNLLAVAELEFNQHIQQEQQQWAKPDDEDADDDAPSEPEDQINNMEQLDMFIESCAPAATDPPTDPDDDADAETTTTPTTAKQKSEDCECDYNEEEENNLAMDDILSRLEQSLRSPDTLHSEINEIIKQAKPQIQQQQKPAEIPKQTEELKEVVPTPKETEKHEEPQELPTDLSKKQTTTVVVEPEGEDKRDKMEDSITAVEEMMPTDLSVPKCAASSPKRPPSQNSETIQSPQPSGIPAVPPSPDIYHNHNNKNKSLYLESLLSPQKEAVGEKEPLDLGKPRESDSPRVTCSQEVHTPVEPPAKKLKLEDLTLKKLLHNEKKAEAEKGCNETPRLLELLTTQDCENADPMVQLKQVLSNAGLNVPDPMLIPKDRLSLILSCPAREIPKLLAQRPELRLPEALAYPHLLQDPDILVITLAQLETIVQKQCQAIPLAEEVKKPAEVVKAAKVVGKEETGRTKKAKMSELSSDIDAATNAAFTQMMWLPYLNQLENAAMSFNGGNPELLKILSTMLPNYAGAEMNHMMANNRLPFPPPAFPIQQPINYNPLELSMWQEAMLQANLTRNNKNQFDLFAKEYPASAKAAFPKPPNPYLNVPAQFQPPARPPNLQIPQYSPLKYKHHGKPSPNSTTGKPAYQQKLYENEKLLQQQARQKELILKQQEYLKHQEMYTHAKQPKVVCKPFANISGMQDNKRSSSTSSSSSASSSMAGRLPGPIDLSGSTTPATGKLKVKQHLVDHTHAPRLLKHDDVAEVGSTTASIEEMQDAQKHLWHPLFGNQKSYTSPWNWTTVTATGE